MPLYFLGRNLRRKSMAAVLLQYVVCEACTIKLHSSNDASDVSSGLTHAVRSAILPSR
jgi:predicted  nucleic acid-binding Zn-ribbon protein